MYAYEYIYTLLDFHRINIFTANNKYTFLFLKLTYTDECSNVI
jgi:hypothetical protein